MNTKFKAIIKNINKENIVKVIKSEDFKVAVVTFACTVPVLVIKHRLTAKKDMSFVDQVAVSIGSFCALQVTYKVADKLIGASNSTETNSEE